MDDMQNDNIDADPVAEMETEARDQGWLPQDEYKGNPEQWRDATEFVEFGRKMNPILRKNNEELKKELAEQRAMMEGYKGSVDALIALKAKESKAQYDAQLNFVKSQMREARNQGDHAVADQLEDELENMQQQPPEQIVPAQQEPAHAFSKDDLAGWAKENQWFATDPQLQKLADSFAIKMWSENKQVTGRAFLDAVTAEVKDIVPHKFTRRTNTTVESGNHGATASVPGYERLPQEAKDLCDDFVQRKLGSRAEYIKLYNSGK